MKCSSIGRPWNGGMDFDLGSARFGLENKKAKPLRFQCGLDAKRKIFVTEVIVTAFFGRRPLAPSWPDPWIEPWL